MESYCSSRADQLSWWVYGTIISQARPNCGLWRIFIMVGYVLSQFKPSELYILSLQFSRSVPILKRLHWLPVKFCIHFKRCAITFRTLKDNQPAYLADLLVRPECSKYLRSTNSNKFVVPRMKTKTGSRAFSISGPALWTALPVPIRNAKTILTFRKLLKSHLFDLAFPP